jgi:hypothetical protein
VDLTTATIRRIRTENIFFDKTLTPPDVEKWIAAATQFADEKDKAVIIQGFARLKPLESTAQDASDQAKWTELLKQSLSLDPDGAQYRRRLADRLGDLACDAGGAPYVARGLVGPSVFGDPGLAALGDQLKSVRTRMKAAREKPDACKGVTGFTEDDWRRLEAIKPN